MSAENPLSASDMEPARSDDALSSNGSYDALEEFFGFVCKYISTFQLIEGKFDQIILLAIGHDKWHIGQSVIATMSNRDRLSVVRSTVLGSSIANGDQFEQEWLTRFKTILKRCEDEAVRRNKLVHSQVIYELAETGLGAVQSNRRLKASGLSFAYEEYSTERQRDLLITLYELAFDVALLHTQMSHWNERVSKQREINNAATDSGNSPRD